MGILGAVNILKNEKACREILINKGLGNDLDADFVEAVAVIVTFIDDCVHLLIQ